MLMVGFMQKIVNNSYFFCECSEFKEKLHVFAGLNNPGVASTLDGHSNNKF